MEGTSITSRTFARSCLVITPTPGGPPAPAPSSLPAPQRTRVAGSHPRGGERTQQGADHASARLRSRSGLCRQRCPPARMTRRITRQGGDKTKACITHVRCQGSLTHQPAPKTQLEHPGHRTLSFTQKAGVSGAAHLLPEKLKTIGSKELGSQLQGTLSARSQTCWTGR